LREERAELARGLDHHHRFLSALHADCDYIIKNFDIRQENRAQEMEALKQATTILSGALTS
jgi:hypothetical protein